MNNSTIYTREKLQGLGDECRRIQKRNQLDVYYNTILPHILEAARNDKLLTILETMPSCLDTNKHIVHYAITVTMDELIEDLSARFPGCLIELAEEWVDEPPRRSGAPLTRILKKGIKIDWS